MDTISKSISASLYEKTKSPLYGTIIISWSVWNWKFIYYLFAVNKNTEYSHRLDYIQNELTSNWTLFYGPIISTILILTVIELIANYSYWLSLLYKTWRVNKKATTEGKQLLTFEQSLKLRNDLKIKEEGFEKLIQDKEESIKTLESTIFQLNKTITESKKDNAKIVKTPQKDEQHVNNDYKELILNKSVSGYIDQIYRLIKTRESLLRNGIPQSTIDFFEAKDYIKSTSGKIYGFFDFTAKGKELFSYYILNKEKVKK